MSSSKPVDPTDATPSSGFFAPGKSSARELARTVPKARQAKPSTARARVSAKHGKKVRHDLIGPTPERIAKGDIVRATGGSLVAEDGLESLRRSYRPAQDEKERTKAEEVLARLHRRCSLDHDPGMNDRMFEAGKKYERLVHMAGLGGIGAQNLLALRGEGNAPHSMPVSLNAAAARQQLRKAWGMLTPRLASALHGLIVEGRDAAEVGREVSTYKTAKECSTAALTALRIALWTIVEARWA